MGIYSDKNTKKNYKSLKFKLGISLVCVFSVLFILTVFNLLHFLNSFFLGAFGLFTYAMFIAFIVAGVLMMLNKNVTFEKKDVILLSLILFFLICIIHLTTTSNLITDSTFGNYLSNCYNYKISAGGVVFGIVVYGVAGLTHVVAAYSFFCVAILIVLTIIIDRFISMRKLNFSNKKAKKQNEKLAEDIDFLDNDLISEPQEAKDDDIIIPDEEVETKKETKIVKIDTNKEKEKAKKILGLNNADLHIQPDEVVEKPIDILSGEFKNKYSENKESNERPLKFVHNNDVSLAKQENKKILSDNERRSLEFLRSIKGSYYGETKKEESTVAPEVSYDNYQKPINTVNNLEQITNEFNNVQPLNKDIYDANFDYNEYLKNKETFKLNNKISPVSPAVQPNDTTNEPIVINNANKTPNTDKKSYTQVKFDGIESKKIIKPRYKQPSKYIKPTTDLLLKYESASKQDDEDYEQKARLLEETLANFKIQAKVVSITKGPAFTRFELQMPQGVPVKRVTNYVNDLAMILESHGDIRVEIPISGKNAFGVEVPNKTIDTVGLRDVLESYNFQASKNPLTYALGKDIANDSKIACIDKMPHMLIAGSTGSGKSVCLNSMIISLLFKAAPDELKFILIDPKRVEFVLYNGMPHMLIPKAIIEPDKAILALSWVIDEMERRFQIFSNMKVRKLDEYNNSQDVLSGLKEKLPYIVVIVDEIGDLMSTNKKEVEEKVMRIAQKSRAAGIHLIVATQRPSVDIITGTIKANLNSRIAFAVSSFVDSKTILGYSGAETLLGKGDMLYAPIDASDPTRIQGAFISNGEVEKIIEFIKRNNACEFDSKIEEDMFTKKSAFGGDSSMDEEFDPLLKDALRIVIKSQTVSISKIQRMFGVGFPRAGKIVDQMEKAGFISGSDGKGPRTIFVTEQEFSERFGEEL